ncbi:MAG: amidohydrolase family protein, partial [Deltaproteobacteria bacterium]|nr:amidohydrolase family protein [Deltaproteobacteria bacterium]
PLDIFAMATINGAVAMARGDLGSLDSGCAAQILAVEFADLAVDEVYAYLVNIGKPNLIWLETGNV